MRQLLMILLLVLAVPKNALAGIDPARAAAIDVASELEKKALDAQYKVQLLQSTGHLWTRQEVDAVTDFQKEFLNSLVGTVRWLNREMGNHPENAFAVALSTRKGNIYMRVFKTGTSVALDIKQFVISDKGKATEAQRLKVLETIRPKLRQLDKELKILCKYIRYTSIEDLWHEISGRHYTPASRKEVALICHQGWMLSAKTAKNTKHK